jgi:hypothetical protein
MVFYLIAFVLIITLPGLIAMGIDDYRGTKVETPPHE